MNPNAQKDLLLTTDYPTDKVIIIEGSSNVPSGSSLSGNDGWYGEQIDINLGSEFLALTCYSFLPDFSSQFFYGFGNIADFSGFPNIQPSGSGITAIASVIEFGAKLFINYRQASSAPARTVYYRLALIPITSNAVMPYNSTDNIEFIFNTDNNYLKLLDSQINTSSFGTPYTINTNLNYAPTVIPYSYISGDVNPMVGSEYLDGIFGSAKNNLIESKPSGEIEFSPIGHIKSLTDSGYRIYIDE